MKTIRLFIIALLIFAGSSTQAQVDVDVRTPNVNVHVGTNPPRSRPAPAPAPSQPAPPPVWGPEGNDEVEYYYLPDIEVYYDIRLSQYIYFENGRWMRARYLPRHCRNYDLYHGYKVVLTDYHGHAPYRHFHTHKVKYCKGYKGEPQRIRGPYQARYENHKYKEHNDNRNYNHSNNDNQNHDHHYADDNHDHGNHNNHGNDNHNKHEGKGHNGRGKH